MKRKNETEELLQRDQRLSEFEKAASPKERRKILSRSSSSSSFICIGLVIFIGIKINQTIQERKAFQAEMVRIVHSDKNMKIIKKHH